MSIFVSTQNPDSFKFLLTNNKAHASNEIKMDG